MAQHSAIPNVYYAIFGFYEPLICLLGLVGTILDPKSVHDQQAPWPPEGPPPSLSRASLVTVVQLAHVCALVGLISFSLLSAIRKHLNAQPALQEKILNAYFTPLVLGDVAHIYATLWALGDGKWHLRQWSLMTWLTVVLGLSLMIPRITWHLGVGRYVDARDRQRTEKTQ